MPPDAHPQRNLVPLSKFCGGGNASAEQIEDHLQVHNVIRNYQTRGFLAANLDPLGITTHPKLVTKSGMQLNANEKVLMHDSKFFKGERNILLYLC